MKAQAGTQPSQRLNPNPREAWPDAFKECQEVPMENGPMPAGFRIRLAAEYFSRVYWAPRSGLEYGQKWAEGCLTNCVWM